MQSQEDFLCTKHPVRGGASPFDKKLQSLSCSQVEITLLNDDTFTYLFESENQKLMLQFLMETDASITSIKNKTISLDELFEEVCQ